MAQNLFLNRSKRLETIEDALDKFIDRLANSDAPQQIRELLARSEVGSIKLSLTLDKDRRNGGIFARLAMHTITDTVEEHFNGLK